jgi:hypothetical protein
MQEIGFFSLKNEGVFDVFLEAVYSVNGGPNVRVGPTTALGYPVNKSSTADLGKLGVPNGSVVSLYAIVVAGNNDQAKEQYVFQEGSSVTANYKITGITISPHLHLLSVE